MIVTERPLPSSDGLDAFERQQAPHLCWRAIFGGTVAAIGIHLLLTSLGVGAGLATFTPLSDADPAANLSVGAAAVWTVCSLVALAFGGFLAGRFSRSLHNGFVHGVLVWSMTLITTLLLLSLGTGMFLGGAIKVLGKGLGIGAQTAASGIGAGASEGFRRMSDQLGSFVEEAVQSGTTNSSPKNATRAKREVGFALARLYNPRNGGSIRENSALAAKSLQEHLGMTEADAGRHVEEWTASYKALQDELSNEKARLEQTAREVADQAAGHLAKAGIWCFFALLAGLLVTALCGRWGAQGALRTVGPPAVDRSRVAESPSPVTAP